METNDKKAQKISVVAFSLKTIKRWTTIDGEGGGGGVFSGLVGVCMYLCMYNLFKVVKITKIANYIYKTYLQSLIKTDDADIKSE